MKMPEILATIKSLAKSQGFYSRLYEHLLETSKVDPIGYQKICDNLEGQHFRDPVDMVLYFET